jgi:hypothetical protein
MLIEFNQETVFNFEGPNLCFLGNTEDFKHLGLAIADLTSLNEASEIVISDLPFIRVNGGERVIFKSKSQAKQAGFIENDSIVFELGPKYWDRLFRFLLYYHGQEHIISIMMIALYWI